MISQADFGRLVAEGEIDEGETKERDVAQASQSSAEAVVTAHPILAMKEEANHRTGNNAS